MQSSPRKGKLTAAQRAIHTEQISKLTSKHQQETELLEDIRNFAKQRAAIEKTYGDSLLKLSTSLLFKKIPTVTEVATEDGKQRKSIYAVWRMVLEENEKLSKARLAAAEVFHQQISESAKSIRAHKMQVNKKCLEQLTRIQEEISRSSRDLDKAKKMYSDEEHLAHDVRDKAHEAEERLKKKKGHFFQSLSSLQKSSNKFSNKKEVCDMKSNDARNEYLLCLATFNAHENRYHDVDLPEIMKMMDVDMYEKTAEYFQLLSQTELFTCAATQTSFTKIKEVADLVTRQHNLKCYLSDWTVLRDRLLYQFEPCEGDKVDCVVENLSQSMAKEAKTSAARIAKETRSVRNYQKKLKALLAQQQQNQAGHREENAPDQLGVVDLEQKIDELRQNIRKAETSRCKAEARIELLRQGGINVEEYLIDLDSLGPSDIGDELSRAGSILSVRSNASGMDDVSGEYYDSDSNEQTNETKSGIGGGDGDGKAQESDSLYGVPKEGEWQTEEAPEDEEQQQKTTFETVGDTTSLSQARFVAIYSYTAQNSDELSIMEQEVLEVVDEGEGDGWVKARNSQGVEGFVPQNYVELETVHGSMYPVTASFSSVDYTMPDWGEEESAEVEQVPVEEPNVTSASIPDVEAEVVEIVTSAVETYVDQSSLNLEPPTFVVQCRALYDYEGNGTEELSFVEGQVIRVIKKFAHSVDDGWWEGEVDGQVGIFPSLVVEELSADGQLLSPEDLTSPPGTEPPMFAPPPMPQFLSAAAHVIITQPTPDVENVGEENEEQNITETDETESSAPVSYSYTVPDFEMEMSNEQQRQYHTQFSANTDNNANETDEAYSEEEVPVVVRPEETSTETNDEAMEIGPQDPDVDADAEDKSAIPDINLTEASPQAEETPTDVEDPTG